MILTGKFFLGLIILFFSINNSFAQEELVTLKKNYNVRILLAESPSDQTHWTLETDQGVVFVDPSNPNNKLKYAANNLTITYQKGYWHINNKKFNTNRVLIIPCKDYLTFNINQYKGAILLDSRNDKTYLINILDLEDYVYCVLKTESWPGWPLEVNKVFAIACRTYAIHMITHNNKKNSYHLKNSNLHQTYKGMHTRDDLKLAVEQTKGLFLAHNNKPIIAMFDICCGGVIPSCIDGFDFVKAPYLARDYACTHCKRCKVFNWSAEYSLDQLEKILQQEINSLKKLKTIKINKKDKAMLTKEVMVVGSSGWHALPIKKIYSLLKDKIKSFCFSVTTQGKQIVFTGKGFGHHLGICQWGAREMVRDGWKFEQVLEFYYPGTRFMKLI
ncbi:MAG: SpoIID/LytB domain-containing protein [Candidatus Dependentiae bacterium]